MLYYVHKLKSAKVSVCFQRVAWFAVKLLPYCNVFQHCSAVASRKAVVPLLWVRVTFITKLKTNRQSFAAKHTSTDAIFGSAKLTYITAVLFTSLITSWSCFVHPWIHLRLCKSIDELHQETGWWMPKTQGNMWKECSRDEKLAFFEVGVGGLLKSPYFDYWQSSSLKSAALWIEMHQL